MVKKLKFNRKNISFPIAGIVLGISTGSLFLDGNFIIGILIGISLSLLISLLNNTLEDKLAYTLVGIYYGSAAGSLLGLILVVLHAAFGYVNQKVPNELLMGISYKDCYLLFGVASMSAVGLVTGTLIGVRKLQQRYLFNN
jgi:hypothetical protein